MTSWGSGPEYVLWDCERCNHPRELTVLGRWDYTQRSDEGETDHEWVVAKCGTCGIPYVFTIDLALADLLGERKDDQLVQSFPAENRPLTSAPWGVAGAYDEAVRARRHHLFTAAALLARRGVEAICAAQGESQGSLDAKLKKLLDRQVIDQRLFDWSNVVRRIGNEGAHDVDSTVTKEDAADSLAFLEALANYLYTFKARYERFERRRAARDAKRKAIADRRAAEAKAEAEALAGDEPPF